KSGAACGGSASVSKSSTSQPSCGRSVSKMDLARLTQIAADTVGAAQRQLPPKIRALARGVAVHYEGTVSADVIAEGFEPDILGLFTGSPHGEELAHDNPVPPQILLYVESLWDFA